MSLLTSIEMNPVKTLLIFGRLALKSSNWGGRAERGGVEKRKGKTALEIRGEKNSLKRNSEIFLKIEERIHQQRRIFAYNSKKEIEENMKRYG